jgi:hypothetical protein
MQVPLLDVRDVCADTFILGREHSAISIQQSVLSFLLKSQAAARAPYRNESLSVADLKVRLDQMDPSPSPGSGSGLQKKSER